MSRVAIRTIRLGRLHGLGGLQLDGLGDGLNVVFGPNSSGKSTLALAMKLVFRPDKSKGDYGEIHAGVEVDGHVAPRDRSWKSEPDPLRPDCSGYDLDLINLTNGVEDKSGLLQEGALGMVGRSTDRLPSYLAASRIAVAKLTELNRRRTELAGIARTEQSIPELEAQAAEAERARDEMDHVQRAIDRLTQTEALERLTAALHELLAAHPGLELQKDPHGVDALAESWRTAVQAESRAQRAFLDIRPSGDVPRKVPTAADLADLGRDADQLAQLRRQAADARRSLDKARLRARQAAEAVFSLVEQELESLPTVSAEQVRELTHAAQSEDARRTEEQKLAAWNAVLSHWNDSHTQPDEGLGSRVEQMVAWLSAESEPEPDRRPLILAVLGVVGALMVALLPDLALRLGVAALVALALAAIGVLLRPRPVDPRAGIVVPVPAPSVANVVAALRTSLKQQEEQEVRTLLEMGLKSVQVPDSPAQPTLRVGPTWTLAPVGSAIVQYHEALVESAEAERSCADSDSEVQHVAGRIRSVLAEYGEVQWDEDRPERSVERLAHWSEACERVEAHRATLREATTRLARRLDAEGVPAGPELDERCHMHRARRDAARTRAHLAEEINLAERQLAGIQVDVERVEALCNGRSLAETLSALQGLASEHKARVERLTIARRSIEEAENDIGVPEAERAYADAMAKLETGFEDYALKFVGAALDGHVREVLRTQDLPELVQRANAYLQRFSCRRFGFARSEHPDPELGGFLVIDCDNREKQFNELSLGTRVHAALALRLALVSEHEFRTNGGQYQYPVVCDEVLAVSDPEATRELAAALTELAKERQVIVFTNQGDDLGIVRDVCPDLVEPSMGYLAPEPLPAPDLPEPPCQPGLAVFDPRQSVFVVAPGVVLPAGTGVEAPSLGEYRRLNPASEWTYWAEKLERTRMALLARYPRVQRVSEQPFVTPTYREQLLELEASCLGSPGAFLSGVRGLKGFRKDRLVEAEEWCAGLADPEWDDVRDAAVEAFGEGDPHLGWAVEVLLRAFVPGLL